MNAGIIAGTLATGWPDVSNAAVKRRAAETKPINSLGWCDRNKPAAASIVGGEECFFGVLK